MKKDTLPLIGQYKTGWVIFWLLLFLMVNALAVGLTKSIRGLDPAWLTPFGLLAVLFAWFLGGIRRKQGLFFLLGLMSGGLALALFNSGASSNLFRAFLEAFKLIIQHLTGTLVQPMMGRLLFFMYAVINNLSTFGYEIFFWFFNFIRGQGSFNALAINFFWKSASWGTLFMTGWMFRRNRHALIASLPVLVLLTAVLGYSRQDPLGLVMALASILVLMVLFEHLKREHHWSANKIDYSEELRFDIASFSIPIISVILIVASLLPSISIQDIRDFYNDVIRQERNERNEFAESLGVEQVPLDPLSDTARGSMPRSHLIGSGPELSNIIVMEIDTGEVYLPPQADPTATLPKYYWFGRSYDIYTGAGWQTSEIQTERIPAGEPIETVNNIYTELLSQNVQKTENASLTMYVSGIPQSVDERITAGWRKSTNEYYSAQLNALNYRVNASILKLSEELFEQSLQQPPEEITASYLQIPESVPERVLDLGKSLVDQEQTPYENARAIEAYLRGFDYTLELPAPPTEQDFVDYFLFDLQRGYCDYYASAMVILARAAGLPARLAVGYATGDYDYTRQLFVVTEANAHAWPEIYIAPFGWIPFEPTAGLTPFAWVEGGQDQFAFPPITPEANLEGDSSPFWLNLLGLAALLLGIGAVGLFWYWIFHRRKHPASTTYQVEQFYQHLRKLLSRLFTAPVPSMTPLEYHQKMDEYFQSLPTSKINSILIKQIKIDMQNIIDLYIQGIYAPQTLPNSKIKNAHQHWKNLKAHAWLLKLSLIFS